jgi:membrane protein required for colicin V production
VIDFVLGIALAAMLVRGWLRGFVRESLDLVGLVLGLWAAFRLSVPLGEYLSDSFGVAPEVARIGGGILLFVLFGAVLSVAAHYLSKVMRLPGLSMVNRVGGAAVAAGWGVLIVLVLVSLFRVLPIPDDWRNHLDESNVVNVIAGEGALPRSVFESVSGDNVMSSMGALRSLFGSPRAVPEGDEVLDFPAAGSDEVRQVRAEAERLVERLNEDRVGVGVGAVRTVGTLTRLAEEHALTLYTRGRLARILDCVRALEDRAYQVVACDNGVALAGTAAASYQGIRDSERGRMMIESPAFDRVGAAVVSGPTGRLVVLVLAG